MHSMQQSLAVSIALHAMLGALAVFGLPHVKRDFNVPPPAIPVEIVKIDDVRRVVEKVEPKPEPQEAEPQKAQAVSTPIPQPATQQSPADSVPLPEAKPDPKPKPKPKEDVKKTTSPNITPRAKPSTQKPLNNNDLAALIDRSIKETPRAQTLSKDDLKDKIDKAVARPVASDMATKQASMMLEDAMRRMVEKCWNVPAGAKSSESMIISIRVWLNADGSLSRAPQLMDDSRMSDSFYRAAAESALRAVRMCAPYELPKERYSLWREMILNFDPSDFLG